MRGGRVKIKRALTLLSIIIFSALLNCSPALAHASVIKSTPNEGEVFATSPKMLSIEFSEEVKTDEKQVRIINQSGQVENTEFGLITKSLHTTVTLTPNAPLAEGSYVLSWKAVSNDGHLVGGGISFHVGFNQEHMSINNKELNIGVSPLDRLAESLSWLGLIILFSLILTKKRKLILITASLGLIVEGARFWEYTLLFNGNPLGIGTVKANVLMMVVNLAVLSLSFKVEKPLIRKLLLVIVVVGFSFQALFQGHVLDLKEHRSLGIISLIIHLAASQVWMASVIALAMIPTLEMYRVTRKRATVAISFLAVSGSIVSYLLLEPYDFKKGGSWQSIFIIKIVLLLLALLIGFMHHYFSKIKFENESKSKPKKSIYTEIGIMVLVIFTTSWLVSFSPPVIKNNLTVNKTQAEKAREIDLVFDDGSKGRMELAPIKPGVPASIMVTFTRPDGVFIPAREIEIFASNNKLNILDIKSTLNGEMNHYMGKFTIPTKGSWSVRVQVMVDDFTMMQSRTEIEVK